MNSDFSLAIISVVFNSLIPLKNTLDSFNSQLFHTNFNVHYFIIDGSSSDGTCQYLETLPAISFISESDNGIFDAMNKGASLAYSKGYSHALFLNAGDKFCSRFVLSQIFEFIQNRQLSNISQTVFVGDTLFTGFSKELRLQKAFPRLHIYSGMPFCHQSVIMPLELISKWSFDISYKCSSDYDWFCRSFIRNDIWIYLDFPVSVFSEDGLTSTKLGSQIAIRESSQIKTLVLKINPIHSFCLSVIQKFLFLIRRISPRIVFLLRKFYFRIAYYLYR